MAALQYTYFKIKIMEKGNGKLAIQAYKQIA